MHPKAKTIGKFPKCFGGTCRKAVRASGNAFARSLMVSDVVDKLGEPVTRDRLREAFFEHFGREDIKKFWERPDNALNTAIIRARDEDLIIEIPGVDGGPALYTGHFRDSETRKPAFPAIHIEEGN